MARTTKPLTNTEVTQAKPREREYNLADGQGLYLRVKPQGSKLWLFNYSRPYTKHRANISLGSFPALGLAKARQKRQEMLELLAQDIDPKQYRDDLQRATKDALSNTLERVSADWLAIKKVQVTPSYAKNIENSFNLHVFPKLGKKPVGKIRALDVIQVLKPIAAKGSLETVKRLCQRLNEVMVYSLNTGIIESNPLSGVQKAFESPKKQNMPTLAPAQLPELLLSLCNANIKRTTRCLIEWQLHTMVRPSEAAGTKWSEINLKMKQWNIPAERMKKKRAHSIPLTEQTLALLEVMRPISGHREHVFPSDRNPRCHANAQTANMALKRMGFGGQLVAHGMRALASTTLNEQAFDQDIIEVALAHSDKNEVRGAYNRAEYLERRKSLMTWWSNHIDQASKGSLSIAGNIEHLKIIN